MLVCVSFLCLALIPSYMYSCCLVKLLYLGDMSRPLNGSRASALARAPLMLRARMITLANVNFSSPVKLFCFQNAAVHLAQTLKQRERSVLSRASSWIGACEWPTTL